MRSFSSASSFSFFLLSRAVFYRLASFLSQSSRVLVDWRLTLLIVDAFLLMLPILVLNELSRFLFAGDTFLF